jgi:hypothetical protein
VLVLAASVPGLSDALSPPSDGRPRNWLSMWKPSIDALSQILGHSSLTRSWSPQDGRIVDLGLHCRVDAAVGNDILISIAAGNVGTTHRHPLRVG